MLNINTPSFYRQFPGLNFASEVAELCRPFFSSTGANYFDYNRVYPDNTYLALASDGYWLEHFLKMKYKISSAFKQSGMHLWDSFQYYEAIHDAKVNFNHARGVTIIQQHENYIEFIDIAAPKTHREITSFYLNHTDQINEFLFDFRDRADRLIKLAEKNVMQLPNEVSTILSPAILAEEKDLFIKKFKISSRELQCFENILCGKTAKQTAEILSVSPRTVEEHITNLKDKLNCRYKRDLFTYSYLFKNDS